MAHFNRVTEKNYHFNALFGKLKTDTIPEDFVIVHQNSAYWDESLQSLVMYY